MQARVTCIGIILDGNRRWARAREVPTLEGHRVGLRTTLKRVILAARDRGIPHLAAYMFSTENWSRSEEEVGYLMQLFREGIKEELSELAKEGVRIRFVGQRDRFATDLQEAMTDIEKDTENNDRITFWACLSYGGRSEIVEAAKALCKSGEDVTEDNLERHLWTAQMPDPDIIIRTSGEKRLSGFLTWKGVYSELFFVDAHWPDFDETMLDEVLIEYAERERRMGK
jgi:undecaprenyl diphosphate synthase